MLRRSLYCGLTVISVLGLAGAAHGEAHFTARLDGDQEVPGVATTAVGTACFTLTSAGLNYIVTVEGLSGPITGAHFHLGARGETGTVLRDILPSFSGDNTAIGLWSPSDAQPLDAAALSALRDGRVYLNIHTAANPGGEIRGQVDVSAGTAFTANLDGDQENPPVAVSGRGTGAFLLHAGRSELTYRITVTGLTGAITGAHIHTGDIGVNGGVAHSIGTFSGNTARGTWTGMTATQVRDLLAGRLYVNIHTAAHPGGEIRGQVLLSSGFGLSAGLDGGQEVPPVPTAGRGSAALTLTPEGLQYDITVSQITGAITGAHFHRGAAGTNGGVIRNITADFGGGFTASGLWSVSDSPPLGFNDICDLLKEEVYLNIHTAAHPGGEIRGQVRLNTGRTTLTATLTGDEEEPPIVVPARGTGTFRLTPAGLEYNITVQGLSGPMTAAHIHTGRIGVGGGVAWDLLPDFGGTLTAQGIWTPASAPPLTPAVVKTLLQGGLYVNIHTAAQPGGEIRGQITLASGTGLQGPLTPEQEVPGVPSSARGTASYTLTEHGLVFSATIDNLSGAFTAAHFHTGRTGVSGGVARDVTGEVAGNRALGVWSPGDASPLTAARVDQLLGGDLYLNVHTAAHPGGELRGQVLLAEGWGYGTVLHGGNEVPPVPTRGTGTVSLTLTERGVYYALTADRLSSALTGAHFHNAPPGVNGGVVRDITGDFVGTTARGNWQPADAQPLTPDLVCELVLGNLYLNLHTANSPGGEIRGNLGSRTAATVDGDAQQDGARISLRQNFPNPAGGTTWVTFALPVEGVARLTVHDIEGRAIATLVDRSMPAGSHQVGFDTSHLPSGIYLYRLEANDRVESRKMLIRR